MGTQPGRAQRTIGRRIWKKGMQNAVPDVRELGPVGELPLPVRARLHDVEHVSREVARAEDHEEERRPHPEGAAQEIDEREEEPAEQDEHEPVAAERIGRGIAEHSQEARGEIIGRRTLDLPQVPLAPGAALGPDPSRDVGLQALVAVDRPAVGAAPPRDLLRVLPAGRGPDGRGWSGYGHGSNIASASAARSASAIRLGVRRAALAEDALELGLVLPISPLPLDSRRREVEVELDVLRAVLA